MTTGRDQNAGGPSGEAPEADHFGTAGVEGALRRRSVQGATLALAAQGAQFLLTAGATIALARLLTPADFGLVEMVMALVIIGWSFKDLGLADATVQRREIDHGQVSAMFWLTLALGGAFALLTAGAAPLIARLYAEPRLATITLAMALMSVFGALTLQHQALLRRRLRLGALATVEPVATALGAGASIAAAVMGAGLWALVLFHLAQAACRAVGVWIACPWRPGRPRRAAGARGMLAFGLHLSGASAVRTITLAASKVVVGRAAGPASLGFFAKAFNVLVFPLAQMLAPVHAAAVATLSRLQHDPARFRAYYRAGALLMCSMTLPAVAGAAACAPNLIVALLGERWAPTAPTLRWLTPAGVALALDATVLWVYVAAGLADRQLKWAVLTGVGSVAGALAGMRWGASGVAAGLGVALLACRLAEWPWCFASSPVRVRDAWAAVWRPMAAAAIGAAGAVALERFGGIEGAWPGLHAQGAAFGALYGGAWLLLPGGVTRARELLRLARDLAPERAPAPI